MDSRGPGNKTHCTRLIQRQRPTPRRARVQTAKSHLQNKKSAFVLNSAFGPSGGGGGGMNSPFVASLIRTFGASRIQTMFHHLVSIERQKAHTSASSGAAVDHTLL